MGGLRFSWLQGFGFSFFALLAACGGRSSTLDPDGVYLEPSRPSGGSTSQPAGGSGAKAGVGAGGATSTGGKSGVPTPAGGSSASGGTAGAGVGTSTGSAGASGTASGGSAGLDPTTFAYCTAFCNVSTQGACPSGTTSAECSAQCASELAGESPECRQIASSFLACLTTAYEKSRNCTEVDQSSVGACSKWAEAYSSCLAPAPVPTPAPDPMPQPTCSSSGSSSNGKCNLDVKCATGAYYSVSCYQTGSAQSNCTCNASLPNGSGTGANFALNETTTFACYDSLAACGFPQIGAK
ncbi:MAG TPA: hypothetical protein VER11_05610 [Polyangiaceae bacterium]|nr:hypothetical protein [Polyangiaceae bacterium]